MYRDVSKNRGTAPKMNGENNGKSFFGMDDLGVYHIFGNTHMQLILKGNCHPKGKYGIFLMNVGRGKWKSGVFFHCWKGLLGSNVSNCTSIESMDGIFTYIYHRFKPNVNIAYMDPLGY